MEYRKIPYVNKEVSRMICGTAIGPFLEGQDMDELLDYVVSQGINTFDLARVYKHAEESFGRWLERRGKRDDLVLISKCAHPSEDGEKRVNEKEMRKDFEVSSRFLHTDYIDIYLLHRDDPNVDAGVVVEVLNALHTEGKIGAFGGSNWTHQRIAEANEYAYKHNLIPFSVSSPYYGLADQVQDPWGGGCVSISGPNKMEARDWYRKNQMPIIAYASLGHGLLTGRISSQRPEEAVKFLDEAAMKGYACPENFERLRRCEILAAKKGCSVPQLAMAWVLKQDLGAFAVIGSSNIVRMQENLAAMELKLSDVEAKYLDLQLDNL